MPISNRTYDVSMMLVYGSGTPLSKKQQKRRITEVIEEYKQPLPRQSVLTTHRTEVDSHQDLTTHRTEVDSHQNNTELFTGNEPLNTSPSSEGLLSLGECSRDTDSTHVSIQITSDDQQPLATADLPQGHTHSVELEVLKKSIYQAITTEGQHVELQQYLSTYWVPYSMPKGGYIRVRPLIEYLFYEDNAFFEEIINEIMQKPKAHRDTLADAFIRSLDKTDLADIPSTDQTQELQKQITSLRQSGEALQKKDSSSEKAKGDAIVKLADKMKEPLTNYETTMKPDLISADEKTQHLAALQMKLKVTNPLTKIDPILQQHNGVKKFAANLVRLIFGAIIFTLLYNTYRYTTTQRKHFWYHPPTNTESKIDALEKKIGIPKRGNTP